MPVWVAVPLGAVLAPAIVFLALLAPYLVLVGKLGMSEDTWDALVTVGTIVLFVLLLAHFGSGDWRVL